MRKTMGFTAKVAMLPIIATIGFISLIVTNIYLGNSNIGRLEMIRDSYLPALQMSRDLETLLGQLQRQLQDAVSAADAEMLVEADQIRDLFISVLDDEQSNALFDVTDLEPLKKQFTDYYRLARETTVIMLAGEVGENVVERLQRMTEAYKRIREQLQTRTIHDREQINQSVDQARSAVSNSIRINTAVVAICVVALLGIAVWIARLVSRTLTEVSAGFRRMSVGNFEQQLVVTSHDELGEIARQANGMMQDMVAMARAAETISRGNLIVDVRARSSQDQLGNAFVAMVTYLNRIAGVLDEIAAGNLTIETNELGPDDRLGISQVNMVRELKTLLSKMQEVIDQVATASQQISVTTKQFATSADEQASTVIEISSTAAEISQASDASSDRAQEVVEASESAVLTGQKGLDAVRAARQAMSAISERIEELALKILQLTEKNTRIGEIVDTVKDLADQSNLLAVNASIEAAKAGDQGSGFAVVATEVRGLAEQSKQATQQIRGILAEIQQATSSAVMATEECGKRANEGQVTVESVGGVVEVLAAVVQEASTKARQIAGASQQQAAGIADITAAMDELARAAKDSATGARGLDMAVADLTKLGMELEKAGRAYRV